MSLWGNKDQSGKFPAFVQVGRILKIKVTSGGTGYANGASVAVTIGAPGSGGVQATATALVTGGVVQEITLTNQGTRYSSTPSVTMATGTGLTVSVVLEKIVYDSREIFFVDATEAAQASNKLKGITSPGWWRFRTYNDSHGDTRYKAECLIVMGTPAATSGDLEDAVVVDVSKLISISVQPASQEISLAVATQVTFGVTASVAPSGTATYQWQVAEIGSTKYTDISGATSASLIVTGLDETYDGKRYRVKISSTGAPVKTSSAATLTVTE